MKIIIWLSLLIFFPFLKHYILIKNSTARCSTWGQCFNAITSVLIHNNIWKVYSVTNWQENAILMIYLNQLHLNVSCQTKLKPA